MQGQIPRSQDLAPGEITTPEPGERSQRGFQGDPYIEPRVVVSDVDLVAIRHDPPVPGLRRTVGELELQYRPPRRHGVQIEIAVHVPEQQVRVEIVLAELGHPSDSPGAERVHDGSQLPSGLGELVGDPPPVVPPVHDTRPDQGVEALGQQRRRHPGHATAQLVEVLAALGQLADHEHGPSLVEQFHALATGQNCP